MMDVWYMLMCAAAIWLLIIVQTLFRKKLGNKDPLTHHQQAQINLGRTAGVHSIQGQRAHMEDYFQAVINVANDDQAAFFAVFDGHGGHRASHYAQQNLHHLILKHNIQEEPTQALFNGFKELDHNWLTMATMNSWDDGSTAIAVLIVNKTIYVANVGDSRAVLSCSGRAIDMSVDHKPNREDEKERIEKLGGRIIHYGTWRVEGVLAVTRAIGDRRLKKYVSAVPEIKTRVLQPGDDYLILASDGVWDVLSSQTACDLISTAKDPKEAAQILTDTAYHSHSMDNITALVIDLRSYR